MKKLLLPLLIILGISLIGVGCGYGLSFLVKPTIEQVGATILYPSGGGTGTSSNPAYGQMLVGDGTGKYSLRATSSLGISGGTGLSNPMTNTGDIIYASDMSGTPARLGTSTDGKVLWLSGGLPAWVATSSLGYQDFNNIKYTWPSADGTIGYVLSTNGSGQLTWNAPTVTGSNVILYHMNTASGDLTPYEQLRATPDVTSTSTDESCIVTGSYCTIDTYVSSSTVDFSISSIPAGVWEFGYYSYVSNTGNTSALVASVYRRVGAVETLLFTATSTDINLTSAGEVFFTSTQPAFAFNNTDRLVVKVQGWTDSGSAKTVHFIYGGVSVNYSHIHTPVNVGNFNFARKDLNETITGSWSFGTINASGILTTAGFLSTASSTITSNLTVTANVLMGSYISQASSTVVGNLTVVGVVKESGFLSIASSTVTGNFTTTATTTHTGFLLIPNGTSAPASSSAGQISIVKGTNSESDQFVFKGTNENVVMPCWHMGFSNLATSSALIAYAGTATTTKSLGPVMATSTITKLVCYTDTGTAFVRLGNYTTTSSAYSISTTKTVNVPNFTANTGDYLFLDIGTRSFNYIRNCDFVGCYNTH